MHQPPTLLSPFHPQNLRFDPLYLWYMQALASKVRDNPKPWICLGFRGLMFFEAAFFRERKPE